MKRLFKLISKAVNSKSGLSFFETNNKIDYAVK
jgi:hypothetical protein